jgi:hypothetical protein
MCCPDSGLEPPTFGGFYLPKEGSLAGDLDFLLRLAQLVLAALRISDRLKRGKQADT